MTPKKILFVCKHNRFRSKLAEAAFKKFNKNKKIKFWSAGIFQGLPVLPVVINTGKKYGLKVTKQPQAIQEKWFKDLDLVIIAANDVPKKLFKKRVKKVIAWKIPDCSCTNKKCIDKTAKKIIKKVQNLASQLEKRK